MSSIKVYWAVYNSNPYIDNYNARLHIALPVLVILNSNVNVHLDADARPQMITCIGHWLWSSFP